MIQSFQRYMIQVTRFLTGHYFENNYHSTKYVISY